MLSKQVSIATCSLCTATDNLLALLKKRKKAKLNPAPETTTATDIVQTVVESPITAPVAAVAAVVVSSVGA